jgi:hypothetical protein
MKGLSAGLTFFNCSTVVGLLLGMIAGGLNRPITVVAIFVGILAALAAYIGTEDWQTNSDTATAARSKRYSAVWCWLVVTCFALFALRSFTWLLYLDGEELKIQSPNNLGDLALHVTFIRYFANGVAIWPDNPIYVFSRLRYPAGVDLFNALLSVLHVDLIRGLVWTGLLASIATCYALYRWGGSFGIAGFLFNGGIIAFQKIISGVQAGAGFHLLDFQGDKSVAWKSIPLTMFITQRGLLYAIPAGLLLLCHWRQKFIAHSSQSSSDNLLPFWVELSLYASMPLFHFHTFVALTIVLVCLFAFSQPERRGEILTLVACAFLPATFFVWVTTEHFHAGSILEWHPGWVFDVDDFKMPYLEFWWVNFGLTIPLVIILAVAIAIKAAKDKNHPVTVRLEFVLLGLAAVLVALVTPFLHSWLACLSIVAVCIIPIGLFTLMRAQMKHQRLGITPGVTLISAAVVIFLLGYLVKLAPWGWDNLKLMVWAYFIVLPFLWSDLIAQWRLPARMVVCIALFGSGFVSLFGGLKSGDYGFADRAEVDWVGLITRRLPVEARFAAYPTYNHPLLLQGRKLALGYPGHLWTEGFDYAGAEALLQQLMKGEHDWLEAARRLRVRYLFWGSEEKVNYLTSTRPWEKACAQVASSAWGTIYDLESPISSAPAQNQAKP